MTTKNIVFISKGLDSASTRYRALQYFPYFKEREIRSDHVKISGGIFPVLNALNQARKADVVILLRKTFPTPITWLLRQFSKKLIFDLDDAIFCSSDGTSSKTRMQRFQTMTKISDHIFAGNQFLADQSLKFSNSVSVIPTSLDVSKYDLDIEKPDKFIDLVWIGSKSTSKYLIDILPALEKASAQNPKLRLKIIADFDLMDTTIPVMIIPWSEAVEAKELASSHIGIAPMRENDWTRGKCALKVLQYMAAGLPVVSANVGVNSEAITQNETGYLVTTEEQWIEKIIDLTANLNKCLEMGQRGQMKVKQNYDIPVVFQKILSIIEDQK